MLFYTKMRIILIKSKIVCSMSLQNGERKYLVVFLVKQIFIVWGYQNLVLNKKNTRTNILASDLVRRDYALGI